MVDNWHLRLIRTYKYRGFLGSKAIADLDMYQVKWESSENVKKCYSVVLQDIFDCNICIWNTDYKYPEGGIKANHRGTLTDMVIIHHLNCIVEVK